MTAITRYDFNSAGELSECANGRLANFEDCAALQAELVELKARCKLLEAAASVSLAPTAWESVVTPKTVSPFTKLHASESEIADFTSHYEGRGCSVQTHPLIRASMARQALQAVCDDVLDAERSVRHKLSEDLQKCEDVLRSLASWLGAGGYNADRVDPAVFEQKIRDGVDMLLTQVKGPVLLPERRDEAGGNGESITRELNALEAQQWNGALDAVARLNPTPALNLPQAFRDVLTARVQQERSQELNEARTPAELARAAAACLISAYPRDLSDVTFAAMIWPWGPGGLDPQDIRCDSVRAAAFAMAAVESIDRSADKKEHSNVSA